MTSLLSYITPLRQNLLKSTTASNGGDDKNENKEEANIKENEKQNETKLDMVTKEDFLNLESGINKAIHLLTESLKTEISTINKVLSTIPKLNMRLDKIENENFEIRNIVTSIKDDLLVEEDERIKLENKLELYSRKIEKKFENVYDTLGEVCCTKEERVGSIENKLCNLEEKLKSQPAVNVVENGISEDLIERIEKMEGEIEMYKKGSFKKYNNNNKDQNEVNKNVVGNKVKENELIANADYILITTSNGKRINTDILDHNSTTQNFICYTLNDVKEFCRKVKVEKQPRKILLHCGNNDLDDVENDILKTELKETVEALRQLFQHAQIVLSSLFPRGEVHLEEKRDAINTFLEELTTIVPNTLLMNNKEIKKNMLNDNKHLKKEGFFIFLTNIRFVLYGQIPKTYKNKSFGRKPFIRYH